MSLDLFNSVPTGAIETLFDEQNQPLFKRADLGRYLGIKKIRDSFIDFPAHFCRTRETLDGTTSTGTTGVLGRLRNPHDVFVNLDGALEIVIRSRKPKAVELAKWLTRKGVEKVVEEHKLAIEVKEQQLEEKNSELALLNDDLLESQDEVRQLEFNNIGLQGEIRAKDQQIAQLQERNVPHAKNLKLDNVIMIFRKHSTEREDDLFDYPYYIARIQRKKIPKKRRWFRDNYPNSEEIVVIDNPNGIHAFNRFEEKGHVERFQCHFKLLDLTRDDLYDLGVPALED